MLLSAGYEAGAAVRRAAYRRGWFKTRRLSRPVISIGNLTVGGTGKTPLVAYVAELLISRGLKPAILTRGYKRQSREKLIAVEPAPERAPDPREVGDEPALLARKLPQVPIVICADRYLAGCLAETRFNVDVHILDDGFQHWALARDVDIVVLDVTQDLATAAALPGGRLCLREPITGLRRADIVVLSRVELGDPAGIEEDVRKINSTARIFSSSTRLRRVVNFTITPNDAGAPGEGKGVAAFSGIGNPRAFFADLHAWGFPVILEGAFRDHHVYSRAELDEFIALARRSGATALLTTEKDLMNFPPGWTSNYPVKACVVETELADARAFEEAITQRLRTGKVSP
jgi:tetraacyldisaccharide 4'-kinase